MDHAQWVIGHWSVFVWVNG